MSASAGRQDPYDVPSLPAQPTPSEDAASSPKKKEKKRQRKSKSKSKKENEEEDEPDQGYQTALPTATALVQLLNKPVQRSLRYKEDRTSCKGDFNLPRSVPSSNRNLKAALLQVSAAPSERECSRCAERKNLWDVCVGGEGCAGCTYNGNRAQCSNIPKDDSDEDPEPQAHDAKSPLGQGASASVHPTDAERLEQLRAMTAAQRDGLLQRAQQDLRLLTALGEAEDDREMMVVDNEE
ncbi:hypothetical protein E8E14_014859 [Neopestalotiopsis sp. 37M]|nr:hypothetical protein E8E14_014859 [Neopestalotiopsis sp. 37M]